MSAGHTPTPWRTNSECGDESVLGPNGAMVADCAIFGMSAAFRKRGGDNVANARFICRAVNAHDDLVEALQGVMPLLEKIENATLVGDEGCNWAVENARAALSKALGTNPTGEVK